MAKPALGRASRSALRRVLWPPGLELVSPAPPEYRRKRRGFLPGPGPTSKRQSSLSCCLPSLSLVTLPVGTGSGGLDSRLFPWPAPQSVILAFPGGWRPRRLGRLAKLLGTAGLESPAYPKQLSQVLWIAPPIRRNCHELCGKRRLSEATVTSCVERPAHFFLIEQGRPPLVYDLLRQLGAGV